MFLSRILLTGPSLRNAYEIHRRLWQLFPDPDGQRDFLFQIEAMETGKVWLLLQSLREPEPATGLKILQRKHFAPQPVKGQYLRFRLVANPVKTIRDGQGRLNRKGEVKSCRVPLIREDEQRAWLERKLDGVAHLLQVEIEKRPPLYFRKDQRPGKIQPYLFQGLLQVEDPYRLVEDLLKKGIGPAKAFGCGLMLLKRV